MDNSVVKAKNAVVRKYFDTVLNEDMKAFLSEAILYAFSGSFSSYWDNAIKYTSEKDLDIIFKNRENRKDPNSLNEMLEYVKTNLSPRKRLEFFDISALVRTVVYWSSDRENCPGKCENFDTLCSFYKVEKPNVLFDQFHNIFTNRNNTSGHPSDDNLMNECTPKKFERCLKSCKKAIEAICASGNITEEMEYIRKDAYKKWEKLLSKANCEPYSLNETPELGNYTIGTINKFLSDDAFGQQIEYTEIKGDTIFLDIEVRELCRRIDTYIRAQEPKKEAPEAPKQSRPIEKRPAKKNLLKYLPFLLLLIPAAIFITILSFVIGFVKENLGLSIPTVENIGTSSQEIVSRPSDQTGPWISGKGELRDTFFVSVNQEYDETITLVMENYSVYPCSLGWTSPATCYAKTDKGSYVGEWIKRAYQIDGATREYVDVNFKGLEGELKSITIEGVRLLKSNGLPVQTGGTTLTIKIKTEE